MWASSAERFSKRLTLAAIALAIPLHLYVDPVAGWPLRIIAAVVFAAGFVGSRLWPSIAPAVATGLMTLLPVALAALVRVPALNVFYTVILGGLFGCLLPRIPLDRWSLPATWKILLATWALTLSLAWPVMIVREAGLRLDALRDVGALDSWALLTTPQVESWILYVVITQLAGLLWLEWLYSSPGPRAASAELRAPDVAHGLWIGASLASLVAIWQGTIDMSFLSGPPWVDLRRAAGTLLDANAYGAIAAIAGPLAFVSIPHLRIRHARILQATMLAVNWAGAWMSGSRTALVCGVVGTLMLVYELLKGARTERSASHARSMLAGAAVLALLVILGAGAIGPLRRMAGANGASSIGDLWSRGGYGTVASRMVRDYPLVGVGVGSFNWMVADYWREMANERLPFDNAQNWWRHQVAELGLVGSLPILAWSLVIAWLVFTRPAPRADRLETQTLRGLLIGIGAASMLGMPTQNPIVLLAFFYCVARFEMLTRNRSASPAPNSEPRLPGPEPRTANAGLAWTVSFVIAIGYAAAQGVLAAGPLNPLQRAARTNRDFIVGTYPSERLPQGQFRWTRKHARFALAARSRHLVVRFHVGHPDADTRPVKLRITTACQTLVDELRMDGGTASRAFELPDGQDRVVFDTDVSRTWKPAETGENDTRDLGVAIEADFVGTEGVVASQDRWIPLKPCT